MRVLIGLGSTATYDLGRIIEDGGTLKASFGFSFHRPSSDLPQTCGIVLCVLAGMSAQAAEVLQPADARLFTFFLSLEVRKSFTFSTVPLPSGMSSLSVCRNNRVFCLSFTCVVQ